MADRPRFSLIQQSHEMYVMGHYIEAAVAYHQVTGNEQALEVAKRWPTAGCQLRPRRRKIHGAMVILRSSSPSPSCMKRPVRSVI